MTLYLNTLEASKKLTARGFAKEKAEAIVEVLGDTSDQLATKEDLEQLSKDMTALVQTVEQRLLMRLYAGLLVNFIGTAGLMITLFQLFL